MELGTVLGAGRYELDADHRKILRLEPVTVSLICPVLFSQLRELGYLVRVPKGHSPRIFKSKV